MTTMKSLQERLREAPIGATTYLKTLHTEAADALEAQAKLIAEAREVLRPMAECAAQLDRELPWARDGRVTFVNPADDDADIQMEEWPVPDNALVIQAWRYHDPQPASERMGIQMRHLRAARTLLTKLSEQS